jgi:hypothetical protein
MESINYVLLGWVLGQIWAFIIMVLVTRLKSSRK